MNKALFLDRDGIINYDKDDGSYTYTPHDFILLDDVIDVLKKAYQNKYLLIIITNQSGIGKSLYSHQDVNAVHDKLNDELNKNGIKLTEIYYCPHHPSTSNCFCRKPDSLLIEKAIARFKINPKISIFVGDKERDCVAANKAGIGTIYHLQTNSSLKQIINALI